MVLLDFRKRLRRIWRKECRLVLAFFWVGGLLCGAGAAAAVGGPLDAWMRSTACGAVSIVSLFWISLFPFLLSALAVSFRKPYLLLLIAFCKAYLICFAACCIYRGFGSAGWLVGALLLFSDGLSVPVLYSFWRRHLPGRTRLSWVELSAWVSLLFLICSIDFRIISPFLAGLIEF